MAKYLFVHTENFKGWNIHVFANRTGVGGMATNGYGALLTEEVHDAADSAVNDLKLQIEREASGADGSDQQEFEFNK